LAEISKKICLLGDFAVGKTSLVRRFVYNLFDDRYLSTIGVKVSRKSVMVPRTTDVVALALLIWDLAGGDEFQQARESYLRGAAGAVLVCDLTRAASLESLTRYAQDIRRVSPQALLIIAANKADLSNEHQLEAAQVEQVAAVLNAPYFLTSAKIGDEVDTLFRHLGRLLVL
jgi:small GTP-binding protein